MKDYELGEKLGQGGMGVVYRAFQRTLHRDVAIKFLPRELTSGEGYVERFRREVKASIALSHPNVVKIMDFGKEDDQHYYVMEFIKGFPLDVRIERDAPLAGDLVLRLLEQLLDALAYCHGRGFIHRDLKPANVMVDDQSHVTLMDFGLVKQVEQTVVTTAGNILGTPGYLAPEILKGDDPTPGSDIWAVGVIAHELMTGDRPFEADNIPELMQRILDDPVPPIPTSNSPMHVGLAGFVERCLEKDPKERFHDATEALEVLHDLKQVDQDSRILQSNEFAHLFREEPLTPSDSISLSSFSGLAIGRRVPAASFAAGFALLVLLVGLGLGIRAFRVGPPRDRLDRDSLRVHAEPAGLRVEWTSTREYRGAVRLAGAGAGSTPVAREPSPVRRHRLWIGPFRDETGREIVVLDDGDLELARIPATPLPWTGLAAATAETLDRFDAPRLRRMLVDARAALTTGSDAAMAEQRRTWAGRIRQRSLDFELETVLARYAHFRDDLFASQEVTGSIKRRILDQIEGIQSFLHLARSFGVDWAIDVVGCYPAIAGPDWPVTEGPASALVFGEHGTAWIREVIRGIPATSIREVGRRSVYLLDVTPLGRAAGDIVNLRYFDKNPQPRYVCDQVVSLPEGDWGMVQFGVSAKEVVFPVVISIEVAGADGAFRAVAWYRDIPDYDHPGWYRVPADVIPRGPFRIALRIESPVETAEALVQVRAVMIRAVPAPVVRAMIPERAPSP